MVRQYTSHNLTGTGVQLVGQSHISRMQRGAIQHAGMHAREGLNLDFRPRIGITMAGEFSFRP